MASVEPSLLEVVKRCDRLAYDESLDSDAFYIDTADFKMSSGEVIGWIHELAWLQLYEPVERDVKRGQLLAFLDITCKTGRRCVQIRSNLSQSKPDNAWAQEIAEKIRSLSLDDIPVCSQDAFQGLSLEAKEATILIAAITASWRRDRLDEFGPLRGWRDEMYTVFARRGTPALMLERAACGIFGVVTYGAHLNAHVLPDPSLLPPIPTPEAIKAHRLRTRVWCPRRAMNKATYPGMLDNTVAGGISNGLSPFETIVKEADEEASIPEAVARSLILPVGVISYLYADGKVEDRAGYIQPEVQYCFDIEVADPREAGAIIPRPNDGESEAFELLDCKEILAIIKQGKFKPNCALVLIDFMIRRGILTEADEPDYIELMERLHRRLPFPTR